jgi:RNA polymerase sigma-70 factor (ECF subfamily)
VPGLKKISDKELIRLFKSKGQEKEAFTLIVKKHQERLYWHIRNIVLIHDDANDVIQNTFIKIWDNLSKFNEEAKLFTWMYRIATNESLTFLNKKKKHKLLSFGEHEKTFENTLIGDPYFNGNEAQRKLREAIASLPEKQRLVFNMKYFQELKYEEISDILDTSVGALKASYHHAVKKIEIFLISD